MRRSPGRKTSPALTQAVAGRSDDDQAAGRIDGVERAVEALGDGVDAERRAEPVSGLAASRRGYPRSPRRDSSASSGPPTASVRAAARRSRSTVKPAAARLVAGWLVPSGWLTMLTPKPATTKPRALALSAFEQKPRGLRPSAIRSLGHLRVNCVLSVMPAAASTASRRASESTKRELERHWRPGAGSVRSSDA